MKDITTKLKITIEREYVHEDPRTGERTLKQETFDLCDWPHGRIELQTESKNNDEPVYGYLGIRGFIEDETLLTLTARRRLR